MVYQNNKLCAIQDLIKYLFNFPLVKNRDGYFFFVILDSTFLLKHILLFVYLN